MNDLLSYPFSSQFSDAVRVRPSASRQATPAFRSVPQFSVIDLLCSRCCRWETHQSVRVPLCLSDLLIGDREGLVLVSHEQQLNSCIMHYPGEASVLSSTLPIRNGLYYMQVLCFKWPKLKLVVTLQCTNQEPLWAPLDWRR